MINLSKFSKDQKHLRKRILEISFAARACHLGSAFSVVDIIDAIYSIKKSKEKFILSNGHAGSALYVVLEKYGFIKNPDINRLGIHPRRNSKFGIDASCGSLGYGLPIAVGMALANRKRRVFCVVSDGECQEGSIWEAMRIARDQKLANLSVVVNANGWGAYGMIDLAELMKQFRGFGFKLKMVNGQDSVQLSKVIKDQSIGVPTLIFAKTRVDQLPFLKGQDAHYHVMDAREYKEGIKIYG